jgi:glucose/arabinose dehydrogenase
VLGHSPVRVRLLPAVAALAALVTAACGGGGNDRGQGAPTTGPGSTGAPAPLAPAPTTGGAPATPALAAVRLSLARVAALSQPVALATRPGDDSLFVAEKGGRVRRVAGGQGGTPSLDGGAVLDLSAQVTRGFEQGLLGLVFSPDGSRLYVDYTDRSGDTQVVEYAFADGRADAASRRVVLSVDQPYPNHNGGEVTFGPDGKLYVGLGDGGSEYDPDRVGQNLGTPLAKILRIDPQPSGGQGYSVPADNPFVNRAGARPETWVWGLRNPWRFSWDRQTRDLWIADVGQDRWEEIDFLPPAAAAGSNLGWSLMDSAHPFHGTNPPGGVLPITEYTHDDGSCSVAGGYVYRGDRIPALRGAYLYGDYCSGKVWALTQSGGRVADQRQLGLGTPIGNVLSFGEDAAGELYLLTGDALFRIQPA